MSSDLTPDWSSDFERYKKLTREVITKEDIINFFNQNQKAFYLDSYTSTWAKMMEAYKEEASLSSQQLNELEEMHARVVKQHKEDIDALATKHASSLGKKHDDMMEVIERLKKEREEQLAQVKDESLKALAEAKAFHVEKERLCCEID